MTIAEASALGIGERVEHTASRMRSAVALGWQTTDPREVDEVRRRWVRLHALLGVR